MRSRAERRKLNVAKALRKKKLASGLYESEYYDNLHQFSKNKIHCSCEYCRSTRKTEGPKASDIRKLEKMEFGETEIAELKDKQEAELL